ncbi:hypothetical protein CLU85_2897 [Acidovorax sp. 69]|uniref:major capsid protein n=1 Tax=Acidovorax sp. 69 TaxID=2035202 RepID=UPI000C249454|nr:major capsid protein [Acidovorax sp. 69]PJI98092.1 hypothetical protein CLU85_2897 [Acidovorax sp. 69]
MNVSAKTAKKIARRLVARGATAAGVLSMLGMSAHAALPAGVTTAISDAGTDMTTAITAIITAFVAFWGLKKLASKFGWI